MERPIEKDISPIKSTLGFGDGAGETTPDRPYEIFELGSRTA